MSNLYFVDTSTQLVHYGVPGMKWYQHLKRMVVNTGKRIKKGVINSRKKIGESMAASMARRKAASQKKADAKAARAEAKELRKEKVGEAKKAEKTVKEMTDDELKKAITRLQNEQTYLSLQRSMKPESVVSKVGKRVQNNLIDAGSTYMKKWLDQQIDKALQEKRDPSKETTKTDNFDPKKATDQQLIDYLDRAWNENLARKYKAGDYVKDPVRRKQNAGGKKKDK